MSALCEMDHATIADFVEGGVLRLDGKYSVEYHMLAFWDKGKAREFYRLCGGVTPIGFDEEIRLISVFYLPLTEDYTFFCFLRGSGLSEGLTKRLLRGKQTGENPDSRNLFLASNYYPLWGLWSLIL